MICTFGDTTDVTWWRELDLPMRAIIGRDGRILSEAPDDVPTDLYAQIVGLTVKQAQDKIVSMLVESGELIGEPRPISHPVKFYERGSRPLEIVTSRQWYIRNGGRDTELRDALVKRGSDVTWHPEHMRHRYENWVEGLNGDWLVSRQRFFGVPIPVWYGLDEHGEPQYDTPLVPDEADLPIDPSTDVPKGYSSEQRNRPNGFMGDPDIFDTWATSSLTPQIAGQWEDNPDLFERIFPMDMRPQAHDIIRTWLFATMVRSHHEFGTAPWGNATLSGWILDPDRKKMSKSKGTAITPLDMLEQYGTDAVRYWAASGRPGVDTAFSEDQMKVGRKLANKLLNVSKFVLGFGDVDASATATDPVDRAMLARLDQVIDETTTAFESFDYARALERTESFFWWFCDNYVELVKSRAYGSRGDDAANSARAALRTALSALQRLFAPIIPFATEEAWNWWHDNSIHVATWPTSTGNAGDDAVLDPIVEALGLVRRAKTEAKVSQRAEVAKLTIHAPASMHSALALGTNDIADAGSVVSTVIDDVTTSNDRITCEVELSPSTEG